MHTLLVLAIAVVLLNYWLSAPAREQLSARAPVAFSIGALAFTAPAVWCISKLLSTASLAPLRSVAAVLFLSIVLQLALRFVLSRVELSKEASTVLRQRVLLNCAVFALALLHSTLLSSFANALLLGLVVGVAFEFSLYVFAEQQARVERNPVPGPFRGAPIALLSAGLVALALMGLQGLL